MVKDLKQIGQGLIIGAILGLMAFIGTFAGNYIWWWQTQHPNTINIAGSVAFTFLILLTIFLIFSGIKMINPKIEN